MLQEMITRMICALGFGGLIFAAVRAAWSFHVSRGKRVSLSLPVPSPELHLCDDAQIIGQ